MNISSILYILVGFSLASFLIIIFFTIKNKMLFQKKRAEQNEVNRILQDAKKQSISLLKEARLEAKSKLLEMKNKFEIETSEAQKEIRKQNRHLTQKEENIERKNDRLERRSRDILKSEKKLKSKEDAILKDKKRYQFLTKEKKKQLEQISGLTVEEAKKNLIKESDAKLEAVKQVKTILAEASEGANKKAKKIIAIAIQRYSSDFVAERTVSVVNLPNEEMKGRIIGREGRNIRTIEDKTGIDLIIDDTPESIVISGFNPIGRAVARIALEKLIADGRIHPARIESVVEAAKKEVAIVTKEAGEQSMFDLGVHGVHNEIIKKLGELRYRTSYSQNVLQHSIEVGVLCGIMAAELGLNVKLAKRIGLLHDIGKAMTHEIEGPHAVIGAKFAKQHGESANVVYVIKAHHEDVPPESVYDILVQAADGLSGARPGARKEVLANYVKRIEEIENISKDFEGVESAYAIQAGREVRVIVAGDKIKDDQAFVLSKDIAKKIEETISFPGQIKITVIRETRSISYANKK